MNVFLNEWRESLKSFLIWCLALGGFLVLMMLIYPEMNKSMADISETLANMGGFSQAFGIGKLNIGEALGYYGLENGTLITIGGGLFAAISAIAIMAKEEGQHTAEFLFTLPHSRVSVIMQKLLALLSQIVLFSIILYAIGRFSFVVIGESVDEKALAIFHLAALLLFLDIALLCFGISCLLRKNNFGLGIGLSLLLYFLQLMINLSKEIDALKYLTPYAFADPANVISETKIELPFVISNLGIALIILVLGIAYYRRKDIRI